MQPFSVSAAGLGINDRLAFHGRGGGGRGGCAYLISPKSCSGLRMCGRLRGLMAAASGLGRWDELRAWDFQLSHRSAFVPAISGRYLA